MAQGRAAAILCVGALLLGACARGAVTTGGDRVPVLRVTDGDTIRVRYAGKDEPVRLIGIDTPEVPWYGGRGECFGVEAAEYVRRRTEGGSVRLEFDVDRRDRYGRLLAYVYLGEELFNLTLISEGFASALAVPPDTRFAAEFETAERAARLARRGLWASCPWSA